MTSDQTLARLIAHIGGMLDQQRKAIEVLEAAISPQPAQGDVLEVFNPQPDMDRVAVAVSKTQHAALKAQRALMDASLVITHHWRLHGYRTQDGTIQHYNAVLTLALGPDAPQFTATQAGWELREVNHDPE